MQNNPELNVYLQKGCPASAIPRRTVQWMINAWRNLSVTNGRLVVNGDRLTIECGGVGDTVLGEKELYKVVALREWIDGEITPIGEEGSNVENLKATWDYVRMHP